MRWGGFNTCPGYTRRVKPHDITSRSARLYSAVCTHTIECACGHLSAIGTSLYRTDDVLLRVALFHAYRRCICSGTYISLQMPLASVSIKLTPCKTSLERSGFRRILVESRPAAPVPARLRLRQLRATRSSAVRQARPMTSTSMPHNRLEPGRQLRPVRLLRVCRSGF